MRKKDPGVIMIIMDVTNIKSQFMLKLENVKVNKAHIELAKV